MAYYNDAVAAGAGRWMSPMFSNIHCSPDSNIRRGVAIQNIISFSSSFEYPGHTLTHRMAEAFRHLNCPLIFHRLVRLCLGSICPSQGGRDASPSITSFVPEFAWRIRRSRDFCFVPSQLGWPDESPITRPAA
jgi:hypothetical protein